MVACKDFVRNQAWLELVLIAQDPHAWGPDLCFDGEVTRQVAQPNVVPDTGAETMPRLKRGGRDRIGR